VAARRPVYQNPTERYIYDSGGGDGNSLTQEYEFKRTATDNGANNEPKLEYK